MKTEKGKLTRIITTVKEKFPEGNDIFGYSGVTREGIVSTLSQTHTYIGLLEEVNDDIDSVWIKRKPAKYLDEISSILKEISSDTWMQKFDRFLDLIFEMRISVKELYISLTDKPLRAEEDIQKAKEMFSELQKSCDSITAGFETIENGSNKTKELLKELEALKTDISSVNEKSQKIITNIAGIEKNANESNDIITEVTPKINTTFSEIRELQKALNLEAEKINTMLANNEKNIEKISERENNLKSQLDVNQKIQKEIQQTLEDVNRHGMAGAFNKRKQELKGTSILWGALSIISMGILIFVSYKFAVAVIGSNSSDIVKHLFKIPSILAGIWLCWFSAKQFGYTIRIREDYSYKYAISMAFEGYKNETREINEELLAKLLEVTVAHISTNPILLYNTKSNHGSPWHELTDGLKKFLKIEAKVDTTDIPKFG